MLFRGPLLIKVVFCAHMCKKGGKMAKKGPFLGVKNTPKITVFDHFWPVLEKMVKKVIWNLSKKVEKVVKKGSIFALQKKVCKFPDLFFSRLGFPTKKKWFRFEKKWKKVKKSD